MSRKKSIKLVILTLATSFTLCVAAALFVLGSFVNSNYTAIKQSADCIFVDEAIAKSLAESPAARQSGKSMRQVVSEAMTEDMYASYLGEQFSLQNVDFAVQASKTVVRDEKAAASVDIFIQNNSPDPVTIPLEGGWSAFCSRGNQLHYTWDSWDGFSAQSGTEHSGLINPGELYMVTLAFTDENGHIADAAALSAELSRSLDGINRIYWFTKYY